jgi:hypothetical protein
VGPEPRGVSGPALRRLNRWRTGKTKKIDDRYIAEIAVLNGLAHIE